MIPDKISNSQKTPLFKASIKKLVQILPASIPSKLYNVSAKIPLARNILKKCVNSLIPESINIEEGRIFLDQSDMAVSGSLAMGSFEKFETETFRQIIRPDMNIVDIGAQIGYYTIIFGTRTGINGKVFAFEPEKENYNLLKKNVETNNLSNVTLINKAVSESSGKRELFIEQDNKGHHSFAKSNNCQEKVVVETDTLDSILANYNSLIIDIIKIDIEGAEPIALRGMRETITRSPHMIIFTEIYPVMMKNLGESAINYLRELESLNFSLSIIDSIKKEIVPIDNIESFVKSIPKNSFRNILARKI